MFLSPRFIEEMVDAISSARAALRASHSIGPDDARAAELQRYALTVLEKAEARLDEEIGRQAAEIVFDRSDGFSWRPSAGDQ